MADRVNVAFRTLGCKVNRVESEDIAADLLGHGAKVVAENDADVIVVNTCTVTGEADAKARKAVRHALSAARRPVVVVTGCLATIDRAMLEAIDERIVVEPDKERVAERVAAALSLSGGATVVPKAGAAFRTRALIKVEEGCDVFCSYCIVPHARGVPRSTPARQVIDQVKTLVDAGVAEVVLTGINLGRYRYEDMDLAGLVEAVAAAGVARVRLSSIEPVDLTDEFLARIAALEAFCPHLHVPMQSGSDSVLEAMRRPYTVAEYEARIAAARGVIPGLAVTTDVIAGFPQETDAQAAETADVCRRVGFAKLHVFRYSARKGTPAAEMPDQVPPTVRASRAAELRLVSDRLRAEYLASRGGGLAQVLVEAVSGGLARGTTEDYIAVTFPVPPNVSQGDLVSVRLLDASGDSMGAAPVE